MTIDDRMRAAQQAQLRAVETEVSRRRLAPPTADRQRRPYVLAVAAAAAGMVLLLQVGSTVRSEPPVTAVAASPEPAADEPVETEVISTTSTTSNTTTSSGTTATTAEPVGTSTASTTTSTTQAAPAGADLTATSDVCPTGRRARLENATLRYLSDEQGWNRKGDLVNEQDGPYYFGLWEPDYPGTVAVEVALDGPVQASDFLLAQHPYQDVSGTITIETSGQVISIELSGRDGFRSFEFREPIELQSFVITRNDAASNITEVILCVD